MVYQGYLCPVWSVKVKMVKISSLPSSRNPPEPFHQSKPCLCQLCNHHPLCYLQVALGWLVQSLRLCHSRQDFGPVTLHLSGCHCFSSSSGRCLIQWVVGWDRLRPKAQCIALFRWLNYNKRYENMPPSSPHRTRGRKVKVIKKKSIITWCNS